MNTIKEEADKMLEDDEVMAEVFGYNDKLYSESEPPHSPSLMTHKPNEIFFKWLEKLIIVYLQPDKETKAYWWNKWYYFYLGKLKRYFHRKYCHKCKYNISVEWYSPFESSSRNE